MIIAVTGHRPDKLWGYDLKYHKYKELSNLMINFLKENDATHCISAMALGVDIVFAISVLKLKKVNPNLILECAIPCLNQQCKWNKEDQELYQRILNRADIITYVSNEHYKPWLMQKRNEYMVDKCDKLLAIWDGSKGGTGNCVGYAKKKNKPIYIINPQLI